MIIFVNDKNGGTTRFEALSVVVESSPNNKILIEDRGDNIGISTPTMYIKNKFNIDISIPK